MNAFKSLHFLALIGLIGLTAFHPWRTINDAAGLRNVADSISINGEISDTMLITQPLQVVLPQSTVDSLVTKVNGDKQEKEQLEQENRQINKELISLRKKNQEKKSALVSEKQIEELLAKQQGKRTAVDEESDLEKDLNRKPPK